VVPTNLKARERGAEDDHYHPGFQPIAFVDSEIGEWNELRLDHREGAERFYRDLAVQGMKVRVWMEASGHARWRFIAKTVLGWLQVPSFH